MEICNIVLRGFPFFSFSALEEKIGFFSSSFRLFLSFTSSYSSSRVLHVWILESLKDEKKEREEELILSYVTSYHFHSRVLFIFICGAPVLVIFLGVNDFALLPTGSCQIADIRDEFSQKYGEISQAR